jgi:glutamate-1-semialdehyde 2,1-aminomutase
VMTGFRVAFGGAQTLFSIDPDLTCMGKIIGGGLPCGAFGGKAEIMDLLAPLGPVYQAGTLSGNPLAMAAGIATLRELSARQHEIYPELETKSAAVAEGVAKAAQQTGVAITTNRIGSMFTWFFTGSPVTDFTTAAASDTAAFGRFHRAMLNEGVWLPPSQFEAAFLGTAHTQADIDFTIEAATRAFAHVAVAV